MNKYNHSGVYAKVVSGFCIGAPEAALIDYIEEAMDEMDVETGEFLEYFFTCDDGFHFVYSSHYEVGFWVRADAVEIIEG